MARYTLPAPPSPYVASFVPSFWIRDRGYSLRSDTHVIRSSLLRVGSDTRSASRYPAALLVP